MAKKNQPINVVTLISDAMQLLSSDEKTHVNKNIYREIFKIKEKGVKELQWYMKKQTGLEERINDLMIAIQKAEWTITYTEDDIANNNEEKEQEDSAMSLEDMKLNLGIYIEEYKTYEMKIKLLKNSIPMITELFTDMRKILDFSIVEDKE